MHAAVFVRRFYDRAVRIDCSDDSVPLACDPVTHAEPYLALLLPLVIVAVFKVHHRAVLVNHRPVLVQPLDIQRLKLAPQIDASSVRVARGQSEHASDSLEDAGVRRFLDLDGQLSRLECLDAEAEINLIGVQVLDRGINNIEVAHLLYEFRQELALIVELLCLAIRNTLQLSDDILCFSDHAVVLADPTCILNSFCVDL